MLEIAHSTDSTAYHHEEPECHGLYMNITNTERDNLPSDPEAGPMVFTLRKKGGQEISVQTLEGRPGLLAWYAENCGYNPDVDSGIEVPIHELIELVASHMLHSHKQGNSEEADDFARRIASWRVLNPERPVPTEPTLQDLRDSLVKVLAILHPGVLGLIHTHHSAETAERAIETILLAKALVAATKV